jgi:hypothetical protein
MFTVTLGTIEQFNVGGIAFQYVAEQIGVVAQIPVVKGKTWNIGKKRTI